MSKFARMDPDFFKKYSNFLLDGMSELVNVDSFQKLSNDYQEFQKLVLKREEMIKDFMLLQTVWDHQYKFDEPITPYREKVLEEVYEKFNETQKSFLKNINFFCDFLRERSKRINDDGAIDKQPKTREDIINSLSEKDQEMLNTFGSMCDTVLWVDDIKEDQEVKPEHIKILYNRNGPVSL